MHRIGIIGFILMLGACADQSSASGQPDAKQFDQTAFRNCVDTESPIVFSEAIKKDPTTLYGYHTQLYNEVISRCGPRVGMEDLGDTLAPHNSDLAYVNAAIEAEVAIATAVKEAQEIVQRQYQDQIYDEKKKAEAINETKAKSAYFGCLIKHAKTLALVSNETADVIAQAALASCPDERNELVRVMEVDVPSGGVEIAARLDAGYAKSLLLEVVKMRAIRNAPKTSYSHTQI